MTQLHRFG